MKIIKFFNKIIFFYYREYKLNLSGFQDILTNIIFFFISIFIFIFSIGPDKETISLIDILEENNLKKLSDKFLEISYAANFWPKWMLKDTKANDRKKAIIGGHYVFGYPEVEELKKSASIELSKKDINLDSYLQSKVKESILRYLKNFRVVK